LSRGVGITATPLAQDRRHFGSVWLLHRIISTEELNKKILPDSRKIEKIAISVRSFRSASRVKDEEESIES
jgi:hypothetical protein